VGKTTLMQILAGATEPDAGNVAWGQSAQFSYFPQDHTGVIRYGTTVYDWLKSFDDEADQQTIRSILGRMLFPKDDAQKATDVLSGGETARLLLSRMLLQQANVLLLDEPTNHLDLESIDSLGKALAEFPGTVIFVSHFRQLVSDVATRIIELTPSGLRDFAGTYEEYLEKRDAMYSAS